MIEIAPAVFRSAFITSIYPAKVPQNFTLHELEGPVGQKTSHDFKAVPV
jgi:hypothetical protein